MHATTVRGRHLWGRTGAACALGALLTVSGALSTSPQPAVHSQATHLVLETVVTMVAALAALLSYGRYRRSSAVRDLLLMQSMALLGLATLTFVVLPALTDPDRAARAGAWTALAVRTVGAVGLMASSLLPPALRTRRVRPLLDIGVVLVLLVALGLGGLLVSDVLPDIVRVSVAIESTAAPALAAPAGALVLQVLVLMCFATAGVAFTARSVRVGDDMLGWFGAAMVLGAWARVAYLAYPSQFSAWLYTGDLLRLGCYLLLVVGAVRELGTYWHVRTGIAVEAERRRLARDLHDGVMQELGYIRAQASRADQSTVIASAADRAIFETRRAIAALASESDAPLPVLLADVAREAGERFDVEVAIRVEGPVPDVSGETREALVRVAREAVINAARHSGTSQPVQVTVSAGRLQVSDSGCGFDPDQHNEGSFGLVSMRERAAAVGAVVRVDSARDKGTRVEVSW
jgi:signal transduction histidine kinase